MRNAPPRITFGMIVLNGMPFVRYNLRALYPFAHQIVVVEGAVPGAKSVATIDGHSIDGTTEELCRFKADEDIDRKVTVVTAEDECYKSGFWPGEKDEMSRAYASRATGDYLWQVDADEFYESSDMQKMIELLSSDPTIAGADFKAHEFWGGTSFTSDGFFTRRYHSHYSRLFKWGAGYKYTNHRPPTVVNSDGYDLRMGNWLPAKKTAQMGVFLYHYAFLFPRQVIQKSSYYASAHWADMPDSLRWQDEVFGKLLHPLRIQNTYRMPGWLNRYNGRHPHQVLRMIEESGEPMRNTDDIEKLVSSWQYAVARIALSLWNEIAMIALSLRRILREARS